MKSKSNYAGYCTSYDFNDKIQSSKGVILACGSCEQHGYHLPLDTDNLIGEALALAVAEKTGMLAMPMVQYGQVWSAKGFPGTMSLSPKVLKMILREIIISLEQQGVRNIVLMSGHNGNYPILKDLAREILDEFGWENIWHFPLCFPKDAVQHMKSQPPKGAPHAGEMETSMMLYLYPELVDLSKATKEFPEPPEDYAYRPMHWNKFLQTGSFGDGSAASAELGEYLFHYSVEQTANLINKLLK